MAQENKTKYEREIAAETERNYRRANIMQLKEQLEADEKIARVMPWPNRSDTAGMREHEVMTTHINHLRELIADEVKAYNATFQEDMPPHVMQQLL